MGVGGDGRGSEQEAVELGCGVLGFLVVVLCLELEVLLGGRDGVV